MNYRRFAHRLECPTKLVTHAGPPPTASVIGPPMPTVAPPRVAIDRHSTREATTREAAGGPL
jgi:hypothetical protein